MSWLVFAAVVLLAYANGANDNFKGVATLYGSGSASYRSALAWATVTTLAGSLLALVLAAGLVRTFSAKGLVPDSVAASPVFLAAAGTGALVTVLLATVLGLPVSTTHALTGALVGAGWVAVGSGVDLSVLGKGFFLPLLVSPIMAIVLAAILYPIARAGRVRLGIEKQSCVCVGTTEFAGATVASGSPAAQLAFSGGSEISLAVGDRQSCGARYQGNVVGLSAQRILDTLHFVSAGAVSFARGLNDTPKMVALLISVKLFAPSTGMSLVALAIALGGVLQARRVAETLAHKITTLNAGQGFIANLCTAVLVIGASRLGLPVSTTHVSTGGLFGIGVVTGAARWGTIATILSAWITTLPLAALVGAVTFALLR